jgi:branched-chain amino acid transport system substrate-binding protein
MQQGRTYILSRPDVQTELPMSRSLLALATSLGFALATLSACSPIPDTIRIGVAQPLSGPLASLGQDMVNGVQMAVDDLNRQV